MGSTLSVAPIPLNLPYIYQPSQPPTLRLYQPSSLSHIIHTCTHINMYPHPQHAGQHVLRKAYEQADFATKEAFVKVVYVQERTGWGSGCRHIIHCAYPTYCNLSCIFTHASFLENWLLPIEHAQEN